MHKLILFGALILISCATDSDMMSSELIKHRLEKDSLFVHASWSPLRDDEKANFSGLKYFPYTDELSFSGPIVRFEEADSTQIYATKEGDIRPAIELGYFPFEHKGTTHKLHIYKLFSKQNPEKSFLFLGFTDETTGIQTYSAGRYIDLQENPDNYYVVNFNYAYNPYCAYNDKYSCALPPAENKLPFEVNAGEKIYKEH